MSRNDDFRYFQRRARVERALAEKADSPCSRLAHLEMARSYEKRAEELTDPVNARAKMRWGTKI